jgi:hypothetical protein
METFRVVEQSAPYLLIALQDRFAVVERRNGKLYNLHCAHRGPAPMTDAGALSVVGKDWCDEHTARRLFDDVVTRYTDLGEHLW